MIKSKRYSPDQVEKKWYSHWEKKGYFKSVPDDRKPFSILIPPPNVTGILHMGHVLNNTIQDVLIRKARMEGFNACWVPGTDHASIATEAKVVRWLREEKGISKADVTREEFIDYAWQWTDKYGGIILQQLRRLGASCDWDRTYFTMDEIRYPAVIDTFIDLYKKGKLYRDWRMVNWDPQARTVLSNEEVIYGPEQNKLYTLRYKIKAEDAWISIATVRPETILGDTAIAVHPQDPRYESYVGKTALVPLIEREIPIIADEYVDREFGTGALKITPAHDPNDYEIGLKHELAVIDILNEDGSLNKKAEILVGMDRFEARKAILPMLEEAGHIMEVEDYQNNVGRSERTNAIIEPRLSLQWYVRMKELSAPALKAVMNDEIRYYPENMKNTYRHWMENIRDWCISRQLWWGHRIPAWYLKDPANEDERALIFVVKTAEEAVEQAREALGKTDLTADDLRQDEDVMDTWFSSWALPVSAFDGFKDRTEMDYYYPFTVLVTAWDIIFLWVARMIMYGYEYVGSRAFEHVYFTGMVRDSQRRRMSKSLGNSPDPLDMMDDYGADGVRFGILSSSPAGGDLLFDDKLCEQGRNFCNKIWNALRLVKGWERNADLEKRPYEEVAGEWFAGKLSVTLEELAELFMQFKLSEALIQLYTFIWNDFCSWYLEMIKPPYGEPIPESTYEEAIGFFEKLMQVLHPFMPFITEEVWHFLREREEGDDCIVSTYPGPGEWEKSKIDEVEHVKEVVAKVRDLRSQNGVSPKEELTLHVQNGKDMQLVKDQSLRELTSKMANLQSIETTDKEPEGARSFVVGKVKFHLLMDQKVDLESECERLKKDLDYYRGFVKMAEKKLANRKFVENAPAAVVDKERQKLADGEGKLKLIEESLEKLGC